jgi:hypothetical protein
MWKVNNESFEALTGRENLEAREMYRSFNLQLAESPTTKQGAKLTII